MGWSNSSRWKIALIKEMKLVSSVISATQPTSMSQIFSNNKLLCPTKVSKIRLFPKEARVRKNLNFLEVDPIAGSLTSPFTSKTLLKTSGSLSKAINPPNLLVCSEKVCKK